MSLKQEIETWVLALEHYDNQQYEEAIQIFDNIADTSKILFNCGVIYATLGEHERAVECYQRAVGCDPYLAIAYFQEGVSNFLLGDFEEALANFNDTLLYLRGNTSIDYEQLGLKFRLFSCEVLFNRGLCYIYLRQMRPGLQDLDYASREKVTQDHDVINDAIKERAEGYTVFSIPVGVVYRPNEAKVKNLKSKDYLGKARLIAAFDRSSTPGATEAKRITPPAISQRAFEDRSAESISYGATNMVKSMNHRSRQHSEPPMSRNMFPPTPPPETDKASTNSSTSGGLGGGRSNSVRAARPPQLDLNRPGANVTGRSSAPSDTGDKSGARVEMTRTASESRSYLPQQQQQQPQGLYIQNATHQQGYFDSNGHCRGTSDTGFAPQGTYADDGFYLHQATRRSLTMSNGSRRMVQPRHQPQQYISEEDSDGCDEEGQIPLDSDFQILDAPKRTRSTASSRRSRNSTTTRRSPPEITKYRIKVHTVHDTRYIMVNPGIVFADFETKIREKFGFRSGSLRVRMRDEEDMVTMGDQEDLDLLLMAAREVARREGSEMGKMEVWVEERRESPSPTLNGGMI